MRGFFHRLLFWSLPPRSSLLSLRLDLLEKSLALFAHIWKTGTSPSRGSSLYRGIRPTPSEAPPRLRGELSSLDEAPITKPGSSPLTRGTHRLPLWFPPKWRFIPAYAGNSLLFAKRIPLHSVHPRLRGELGSLHSKFQGIAWFIPAYAGNSKCGLPPRNRSSVHPRLRGELAHAFPLVLAGARFIPAYAGNSSRMKFLIAWSTVHPRLRGELTYGTHTIPPRPVHPRLRGELRSGEKSSSPLIGSSPLTRGTQAVGGRDKIVVRFIPAYAGNSWQTACGLLLRPVHPRLRGELFRILLNWFSCNGSSPLTRGTRLVIALMVLINRFIPAYAGNSPFGFHTLNNVSVHPRLRGELT